MKMQRMLLENEGQVMVVAEVAAQDRIALPKAGEGKSVKLGAGYLKRQAEHHIEFNFPLLELRPIVALITSARSSWFALFLLFHDEF